MIQSQVPFSSADKKLIYGQLHAAYWVFALMGTFILSIGFFIQSMWFAAVAALMLIVFTGFAKHRLDQTIGVVLRKNVKTRLIAATLDNKDTEVITKQRRLANGGSSSEWKYCFFINLTKIDVGMKVYEQFNVGDVVDVDYFEFPPDSSMACGLLSIKKSD